MISADLYKKIKAMMLLVLRQYMRPEFLNRIDEIVVFKPLNQREIERIVELEFVDIQTRLMANGLSATLTDKARAYLAKKGYDPQFGARPLNRVVKRLLTDQLANYILSGSLVSGDKIVIDAGPDSLVFNTEAGVVGTAV